MGIERVQERAQHTALRRAGAESAGGGVMGAKSHTLGAVSEDIFDPGTGGWRKA